ncbi:DUF309 domain-containing protein [Rhodococcus tukisamuensis]|uniref:DUF309 domain-containing protein n=1 Tax=Rhodococcus tukisamuensis TaxID=168276 RepID=A0A1G6ZRD8_9NOCA|nr:DUF309 domain-containing protein [Rhodococcus tukisamuensis]SDE05099.1 hypothetical protein SAMN05444580_109105 [Rhodococcus tukisamuensis]
MDGRERDASGRPLNARPRDGLGRLLPRGATGVPRVPEGLGLTPVEAVARAQELLDAGMPFHAHEVFEEVWKSAPEAERELWQGLAQLAVGLTHLLRGNAVGARSLLERGAGRVRPYAAEPPYGLDVAGLLGWASGLVGELDGGPDAQRIPRLTGPTGSTRRS